MAVVKTILLQFFVALLCVGSIAGLLMGIAMLLKHKQLERVNHYFSHWYHADKITEPLDRPRWTERFFYRHHRLVGALVTIASLCTLYIFLISYNVRRIATAVAKGYWGLVDAVVALLLVGSALAAIVGIFLLIRPSVLRDIEKLSNRWISTEGLAKFFDRRFDSADQHLLRRRNIAGILLIVASLYILIVLGNFLWRGGFTF